MTDILLSLAALHAECRGDCREYGDDEIDDGFPSFFFHILLLK